MGLVIIGMCIYLSFIVALLLFLLIYILINGKRNGFLKTIKSIPVIIAGTLVLLLGGLFISSFIPTSSKQLFRKYVVKPIPESVQIVDSFDGSPNFYPDECLHFKISPDDFQLILAAKNWQIDPDYRSGGFQCGGSDYHWHFSYTPLEFRENVVIYTFVPYENDIEVMFVNSQTNEVYYFFHDGNMP
jgi:hypothetical protein